MATIGTAPGPRRSDGDGAQVDAPFEGDRLVAPAKAVRLLDALGRGLHELDGLDLDDAGRAHVIAAHRAALIEVASTVSDGLIAEMVALRLGPLDAGATQDEIRVAQAELVGWVDGLLRADAALDSS